VSADASDHVPSTAAAKQPAHMIASGIVAIDHVQVAIPRGSEDTARRFYGEFLGISEVPKPSALAARGGCWFRAGSAVLHLGVEHPFAPARKAHPAFLVTDLDALEEVLRPAGRSQLRARRWQRVGVAVVMHNATPTPTEKHAVVLVNCGPRAALTAFTAAQMWGLDGWERTPTPTLRASAKHCT
jgi:hypothetical protein